MKERPRPKYFPPWLKKSWPLRPDAQTAAILEDLSVNTVCRSAECPNQGECWAHGTATFLILGDCCTRACRFCAVRTGTAVPLEALADEPARIAQAVKALALKHVVITSVTRDDLYDEGAEHFARVVAAIHALCGAETVVEVLVPDFHARADCIRAVLAAHPGVFNHNLETVERLYPSVRPQGDYRRALKVLETARRLDAAVATKSGLMVGLGETPDEVRAALRDLRGVGCDILTIGQYLQPSQANLPVAEFVPLEVFREYQQYALSLGFRAAACGPFVRSSYQAESVLREARTP